MRRNLLRRLLPRVAALALAVLALAGPAAAAPMTADIVRLAAENFIRIRFPAPDHALSVSNQPPSVSRFRVAEVTAWSSAEQTRGFVGRLAPTGYVLFRADDTLAPIKSYSENGSFENMPPFFRDNLAADLDATLTAPPPTPAAQAIAGRREDWSALLSPSAQNVAAWSQFQPSPRSAGGPLIATQWYQDVPYNLYAPAAAGGPGGRAWAGCVGVAMGQILCFHAHPVAVSMDRTYTDTWGQCRGTHSLSDVGLGPYDWANMPTSLAGSTLVQQQAVARLLYHCAVSVSTDFEGVESGADANVAGPALRNYFAFKCDAIRNRADFTAAQWFDLVKGDIVSNRPIGYGMYDISGAGHALVCDGYDDSGLLIHLNFGWGGAADAWYAVEDPVIPSVPNTPYVFPTSLQGAILNIRPCAPLAAIAPHPALGATNVPIMVDCTWSNGGNAKGHVVYFGTHSGLSDSDFHGTRADTNRLYAAGPLAYVTTYYWRIDSTNGGGVTTGAVWNFTTAAAPACHLSCCWKAGAGLELRWTSAPNLSYSILSASNAAAQLTGVAGGSNLLYPRCAWTDAVQAAQSSRIYSIRVKGP